MHVTRNGIWSANTEDTPLRRFSTIPSRGIQHHGQLIFTLFSPLAHHTNLDGGGQQAKMPNFAIGCHLDQESPIRNVTMYLIFRGEIQLIE